MIRNNWCIANGVWRNARCGEFDASEEDRHGLEMCVKIWQELKSIVLEEVEMLCKVWCSTIRTAS